jgi:Family of unknown function (DUF6328)
MEVHLETLEEEATHATDEARMVLPGVQAILGFQLIAVFNQRFENLSIAQQYVHLGAFLLVALAMGLLMAPAAFHRQVERGQLSRRFVNIASAFLSAAMAPLALGVALDAYLISFLISHNAVGSALIGLGVCTTLSGLWFLLPFFIGKAHRSEKLSRS